MPISSVKTITCVQNDQKQREVGRGARKTMPRFKRA
jgi:hypothetical protein